MPPPDDHNKIEDLKKSLYSRTAPDVRTRRKLRFTEAATDIKSGWGKTPEDTETPPVLNQIYEDHSMSFFTKILIGSSVFFVLAVGIGLYVFFNGANLISANNIDISISGPVSIPGGAPVSFDIHITNKNNVDLQLADMSVDFPAGTTNTGDTTQELKTYRELVGDIRAGDSVDKTVSAIMFGEENLQKQILVTVTYKIKGSTSLFTKTKSYDVLISSSPVVMSVSSFKEITAGQEFDMTVKLKSNSQETLKSVLVKANYPFGYTFLSSNVKPLSDNSTWKIGDIPSGGERTIVIHGKLQGENTDTRIFRFVAGAQSASDPKSIGTQYMTAEQTLAIEKPFISVGIAIDNDEGSSDDHIGQFGQPSRVVISWFNNLDVAVSNMTITAKLSGSAYDKTMVQPDQGVFQSASDEIVWNQQTNPALGSVGAGESGTVSFTITPRNTASAGGQIANPTITINTGVTGNRTQESNVPESLSSAVSRNIKISSAVSLTGRVVRSTGPFLNTGPIPPKAEQTTTYTVLWTVDNTSSAVGNAQVTTTLPPYVKWVGAVSPTTENVTYDQNSGNVTWSVGNIDAYTANSSRRREVAFQISFQPGINQANQSPTLVNQSILTAVDNFTGAQLQSTQDFLTTRFSTDPTYKEGQETVVK